MASSFRSLILDTSAPVSIEPEVRMLNGDDAVAYNAFLNDPLLLEYILEDDVELGPHFDYSYQLRSYGMFYVWGVYINTDLVAVYRFAKRTEHCYEGFISVLKECRGAPNKVWSLQVLKELRELVRGRCVVVANIAYPNKPSKAFVKSLGFVLTGGVPLAFYKKGDYWPLMTYCLEI